MKWQIKVYVAAGISPLLECSHKSIKAYFVTVMLYCQINENLIQLPYANDLQYAFWDSIGGDRK